MKPSEVIEKIIQEELEKINNLSQEDKEKVSIENIIYMGKIKGMDLYRIYEKDDRENASIALYKYFDENGLLRGVKNIGVDGKEEWLEGNDELFEMMKDEIDRNESILEEELEQVEKELGVSREDIDEIKDIDIEDELEKDEEEENDEELEEDEKEKESGEIDEKKFKQTSDFKNVRSEIDTNTKIDQKGHTLATEIPELKQYSKIAVVNTHNLSHIKDENGKSAARTMKNLALIGYKEVDGKQVVEKIPEDVLQYYQGANEETIRFDSDDQVEKNSDTSARFIKPGTNKGLAVEIDTMQTKVYYQGGIDVDDNTAFMIRLEDKYTGRNTINTKTREIFNPNRGIYNGDKINEEMEMHREDDGDKIDVENADGDFNTVSHIHEIESPDSEIYYKGEVKKAEEVARDMNIPLHIFISEYNRRAEELENEEDIEIYEDVYEKIEERSAERKEKEPQRDEEGFGRWDNHGDPREH